MTYGPADTCPCPHCKKPNDFSDDVVDKGMIYVCDSCGKKFEIVDLKQITVLCLKPL